jgi:hypothetical protein
LTCRHHPTEEYGFDSTFSAEFIVLKLKGKATNRKLLSTFSNRTNRETCGLQCSTDKVSIYIFLELCKSLSILSLDSDDQTYVVINAKYYLYPYFSIYFTYFLTPWSIVLLEKLTGSQLVNKFPAFHGTRISVITFTSVRYLSNS